MASSAQVKAFIERMAPIAMKQAKKHDNKIFASVCIAQACCESAYGTTQRMIRANAVYGIKVGKSAYHFGSAWKDLSYNTATKEVVKGKYETITDNFRAYSSLDEATEDYFDLLCTASRYKKALNAKDYKECIRAIAPSYATAEQDNCKYSKTIISIIEKYDLAKYDTFSSVSNDKDINPYQEPKRTLKRADKGDDVKWVQWELVKRGLNVGAIDGIFGQKTYSAVCIFQKQYDGRLAVDGIVGKYTIAEMKKG